MSAWTPDSALPTVTDDPDGPITGEPAQLPILSRDPASLPVLDKPRHEWAMRLGILAFACSLFLPNLGSFGLWDPWETHYGEVTRYMIETGDWVHPWWGYKGEKIGGEKGPGEHFYSKPILLFWMEAATISALGLSELSIRLPVALIAIFCIFCVYFCFSKLLGRPRGVAAALVLGTCPQFFFLARQSQTDMPFVGTLTIAMSFFMLAVFGKREQTSDRRMWAILTLTILIVLGVFLPQLGIVISDVNHAVIEAPGQPAPGLWAHWKHTGWMQAATFGGVMSLVLLSICAPVARAWREGKGSFSDAFKDNLRRKCYLWIFYAFCGLSLMAKGLLGFMLPGAILFIYLAVTNEWTLLVQPYKGSIRGRVELWRGIFIFLCVGLPWYVALLSGPEGNDFYTRFIVHDHFNRLGSGVHSIDDGSFEHFFKWLGFGMWPWVAFMPITLLSVWRYRLRDRGPENRLKLLLFLWFFIAWTLFTLSSTKFHHYIFPALPPLALLVAWTVWDMLADKGAYARFGVAVAIGLVVLLGHDLFNNPQHLRNQFTYKYDREYPAAEERPIDADALIQFHPEDTSDWEPKKRWAEGDFYKHTPKILHEGLNVRIFRYERWILIIGGIVLVGLLLMLWVRTRRVGFATIATAATAMAIWGLNWYMPQLSTHWSQKYLFDRYYDECHHVDSDQQVIDAFTPSLAGITPFDYRPKQVCREEVISWLLTWRGETFYSNNEIRPIQKENKQMQPYLKEINKGARYFVHIERSRAQRFKKRADEHVRKLNKTNPHFKGIKEYAVTLEHNENYWFVLLKADPICKKGYHKWPETGRCKTDPPPT